MNAKTNQYKRNNPTILYNKDNTFSTRKKIKNIHIQIKLVKLITIFEQI